MIFILPVIYNWTATNSNINHKFYSLLLDLEIHNLNIINNITHSISPQNNKHYSRHVAIHSTTNVISIDRSNIAIQPRKSSLRQRFQPLHATHIAARLEKMR